MDYFRCTNLYFCTFFRAKLLLFGAYLCFALFISYRPSPSPFILLHHFLISISAFAISLPRFLYLADHFRLSFTLLFCFHLSDTVEALSVDQGSSRVSLLIHYYSHNISSKVVQILLIMRIVNKRNFIIPTRHLARCLYLKN